jgi:hypothetical protein
MLRYHVLGKQHHRDRELTLQLAGCDVRPALLLIIA